MTTATGRPGKPRLRRGGTGGRLIISGPFLDTLSASAALACRTLLVAA